MTEPTDAELDALRQADNGALNFVTARAFRIIARTALAKWGTPPAVAGEHKPGCPALVGYGHGVEACCCGATPQPTQAQAGAVPLTAKQMESGRDAIFSTGNPYCPCDSKTFRKVAEWVERHHGITHKKGGQHAD